MFGCLGVNAKLIKMAADVQENTYMIRPNFKNKYGQEILFPMFLSVSAAIYAHLLLPCV